MSKNNKKPAGLLYDAITFLICVIPIVFSIVSYKKLPDELPVHFGIDGIRYGEKYIFAIIVPIVLLALQIFVLISVRKKDGMAVKKVVCSIIPTVSIFFILGLIYYLIK